MPELLRVFTSRAVEILSPKNINSFGIKSHPVNYQSVRFKSWQVLCNENNSSQLNIEMTQFLVGKDSIKNIHDLGNEWTKAILEINALGKEIDKEKSYSIIKDANLELFFEKEKGKYFLQRTAISDTILCLSHLKHLSHSSNMDYMTTLKVMTFVERCIDYKMQLPELNIQKYYERQIIIPSCFSKIDSCNPVIRKTAFPFLEVSNSHNIESRAPGCTSDKCICEVNDNCVPQSKCCAKPRIDLIDLLIVKDYTKCYQPGDLSFIKNVLEGEELVTKHRRFERTEELIETETDIRQFEEKYLQTEDKASLQKETENIQKQDSAFEAGVTANADWGTYSIQADSKYSSAQSKSQTNKDVVNSSKEVIDRATKQVEEKVRKLVSTKRIFETEEKNEHTFKGVNSNISGQYLYVNKISRAQVFNYGRKAVIDLVLPEPASLYKKLFHNEYQGVKPIEPLLILLDPQSITPINYKNFVSKYGIKDVELPPKQNTTFSVIFKKDSNVEDHRKWGSWQSLGSGSDNGPQQINIPNGYFAKSMQANLGEDSVHLSLHNGNNCYIEITLGGASLHYGNDHSTTNPVNLSPLEGNQTVTVFYNEVLYYQVEVIITCELKPESYLLWQTSIYNKIMEVNDKQKAEYQQAFIEYSKAKEEFEAKEEELKKERYNKNPFINRETEKAELKRMVISYISCQFYDQFDAMKNRVEPCGYPEMNIKEAEQEGKFVQFFEQAFNWNLITYIFYPYFWGRKCTWSDKLKEESSDLIFKKFLEAGSCRVLVPIRDGYFDYVSWFVSHGEIWERSGTPPLPDDPHYVSLAQEIKEQKENFYSDRDGYLDTTNGGSATLTNTITLYDTDLYWHYATPAIAAVPATVGPPPTPATPAIPATLASLNMVNISADIDREIIIDCKVYRIVSINEDTTIPTHTSWKITLDRDYDGVRLPNIKWSTGAVFVGAPWEFITPTTLTFLRDKSSCLPCYPLKACKEL